MAKKESDVLEYLKWWYTTADFGPADGDVRFGLNEMYESETGKKPPKGYGNDEE